MIKQEIFKNTQRKNLIFKGLKLISHENWLTPYEKVWTAHETGWTQH